LAMADRIDAGTDEKSMQPAIERVRVAQSGQVAPCPDERFLDGVAGQLSISKDQSRGCVQPCDARADEHGEGVMIALPGSFHESSLVHGCLRGCLSSQRGRSGALGWYVGRPRQIVPTSHVALRSPCSR